ncbi:MAG TPA: ABC transporter substrate-binding protein [Dehalococcoidia bacterium]|nr:ABC transporter substrate-binding protein [Dehalococcoidia bacterium]
MVKHLRWLFVVALLLAVSAMAACGDDEEGGTDTGTPGATQFEGTIKIGQIVDETGPAGGSPILLSFKQGMQKAIRDINAAGGVKVGGKAYRLELVSRDSRSDPTVVVAVAEELIQQKVIAVDVASAPFFDQAYQRLNPGGILSFMVLPQGLGLLEREPDKNPLLASPIELATPIIVGWAKQIYTILPQTGKRIAYIAQDDPLGRAMEPANREAARQVGGELVAVQYFPIGTTDFSSFLTNIKAARPDIVYMYPGPAQLELATQAVQLDVAPVLEIPGFIPALLPRVGDLGTHTIVSVDWRLPFTKGLTPPQYVQAVESLGQLSGGLPLQTGFAIAYHDFIYLLKAAMEKAGTVTDSKAIAAALAGLTYSGPFGKVEVLKDRTTRGTMGLIVAKKDQFTVYVYDNVGDTSPNTTFSAPPSAIR